MHKLKLTLAHWLAIEYLNLVNNTLLKGMIQGAMLQYISTIIIGYNSDNYNK